MVKVMLSSSQLANCCIGGWHRPAPISGESRASRGCTEARLPRELTVVACSDDIVLHGLQRLLAGHARSHGALKKISCGPVAVIATNAKDDCTLLLHGSISIGQWDNASTR